MTEVVFVGTSDAFGAGGRRQSAVLARCAGGSVLLDCGVTTNTGLNALGIEREEIDAILISHFHGDHFGGVPLLLLAACYEDQRKRPLHIAGPPEIETRVRTLARAMGHPIESRELGFPITFTEVLPGSEHAIGPTSVRSFETNHQLESHPHGYRLSSGDHTIVYSGDTGWFDDLPRIARGADLFVCECTFHTTQLDFHLNYELLWEQRPLFDCDRLLLTHLGSEMSDRRGLCEIDTADDGLVVKL